MFRPLPWTCITLGCAGLLLVRWPGVPAVLGLALDAALVALVLAGWGVVCCKLEEDRRGRWRVSVCITVRTVGIHFACCGVIRDAKTGRQLAETEEIYPYGFRLNAIEGATRLALERGWTIVNKTAAVTQAIENETRDAWVLGQDEARRENEGAP